MAEKKKTEAKQCEYIIHSVGAGMFRSKRRCQNTAYNGKKYCYQHRRG